MQYKVGTVTTNGTNQVTGSGTAWATNAAIGDLFWIQGQNAPYYIGNVNSDTLITLTSVFAGPNAAGQSYVIARSFTANQKLPYPESTDIDTHTIVKRAMTMLDTIVGAAIGASGQANRVIFTDASGNLTSASSLGFNGSQLTVTAASGLQPAAFSAGGAKTAFIYTDSAYTAFGDATALGGNAIATHYSATAGSNWITLQVNGAEQARIVNATGATRYITLTGSNGGNPTIGASAGDISISTGLAIIGTLSSAHANSVGIDYSGAGVNRIIGYGSASSTNIPLTFLQVDSSGVGGEVARFTTGGYFKASNSGTYNGGTGTAYHEFYNDNNAANQTLNIRAAAATATNQYGIAIQLSGDPNNTSNYFAQGFGGATERFTLRSNGGLANFSANNVNLSDGSIKVGMVPAPDYCDFIEKASTLLKVGAYEDDPTRRQHTMFDSREVESLDASLISPWQHTPLLLLKGLSEHEIQMRHLGATGALLRRMKRIEQQLGIQ